ncbi:HNH endonuclease domain-containing protein [uncultured Draconibacterium sp.]|uniref:HNH endonuclease domain-containing protein n=1 Tax=uncultured Draconibacterium sp. TaxID=1573823 RepID=UPI002AA64EC8|nr:HNH endonuclease domain-containing protein [uncultured Draconibacterium sp.]
MRPIRINHSIVTHFSSFIDEELHKANSVLSNARNKILALRGDYDAGTPEYQSLNQIAADFKSFLLLKPSIQAQLIDEWNEISPNLFYGPIPGEKIGTTEFGNNILKALNYPLFRKKYASIIIDAYEIRTCPYCNAMLTITTTKSKGRAKARFQLDHYFPKSKHPLLSISIFNLIPCCGNCNQSKSNSNVDLGHDFHLLAEETPLSGFKFEIPNDSISKYQLTKDVNDIIIRLKKTSDSTDEYVDHHNSTFDIEGIYNTQKDVVEEIFWLATAYNESRIEELSDLLGLSESVVKRLVLGNYVNEDDIHKRPLAKFQQDIARQLKLID